METYSVTFELCAAIGSDGKHDGKQRVFEVDAMDQKSATKKAVKMASKDYPGYTFIPRGAFPFSAMDGKWTYTTE